MSYLVPHISYKPFHATQCVFVANSTDGRNYGQKIVPKKYVVPIYTGRPTIFLARSWEVS